jgi:SAM-dependent methyltransferase/uncharacterized protein YbaR (Trm112 family)
MAVRQPVKGPGDAARALGVWPDLLEWLACPACQQDLTLAGDALICARCDAKYPVVRRIPRFVKEEGYVSSFGFQWTKHARTQLDRNGYGRSDHQFRNELWITPEEVRGKVVLDAGCGMGRYAEVASRYGARVIGLDLSQAVESAGANLCQRDNVQIIQGDILSPPLRAESFDFIYSIGVLHHTSDCEAAFRGLVKLLKPGGKIVIWLYSAYGMYYKMSDLYRKVTTRMPPQLLHALSYISVPLYYVDRAFVRLHLRPLSGLLRFMLPAFTNRDPDWRWRVLHTFDWYSPKYQSKHTYEEVFRWFESEGLVRVRVLSIPIGVSGEKPPRD